MKYTIEMSTKFKKDYKLAKKRGYDIIERKKYINLPLYPLFYIDNAHILWYNEYTK